MEDIRSLTIDELIHRLRESVSSFVAGMESVVSMNKAREPDGISELRDHIVERLKDGEEIKDSKRLISLLDLLSRDQAVLELVKDDAREWLEVIETIEERMEGKRPLGKREAQEIQKIRKMSGELKALIRG